MMMKKTLVGSDCVMGPSSCHGVTSATTTWDFPFRFAEFNPPGVNYTFVQNRNSLTSDGLETYMEREEVVFVLGH
jgi:hypothetical protein